MGEWLNQRSAKPSTAVRIRFGPHQNSVRSASNAVLVRSEAGIIIEFIRVYLSLPIAMYILNISILRLLKFFVAYLVLSKSLCTFMCKL